MSRPIHNIEGARLQARRRLPRAVFDYVDGGADDEETMRRNREAFRAVSFRPRMAAGVSKPAIATTVVGEAISVPILLAPCGFTRVVHPDGEAGAARAAHRLGTISILSTASGTAMERVIALAPDARQWFQVYFLGGREGASQLVDRAEAAGFGALVVTVDTAVVGNRERDVVNGVPQPLRVSLRTALAHGPNLLRHPQWLSGFLRDGTPLGLANAEGLTIDGAAVDPMAAAALITADPPTWADVEWLRERWSGPLVVKGILGAADAIRAVNAGATAVLVSNHGGRQLDGAPATLDVVGEVAAAVGSQVDVLLDGGVRRGTDVVKAVALGARAVLIGRPYLWGLACDGEAGVERVLRLLRAELIRTMKLLGCPSLQELDASWVRMDGR